MRRLILAAAAVLLLHAAPAMASECTNLALPANGGVASVSSVYSRLYPATSLNSGVREHYQNGTYPWYDGTAAVWPDWAQIEWAAPQSLDRIVLIGEIFRSSGFKDPDDRNIGIVRVQYWDAAAGAWADVVGRRGQDNPTTEWVYPYLDPDGSETRRWDFAPITTTRIRAVFEGDSGYSWSTLDEIEAYGDGSACDPPAPACENRAQDAVVTASSVHGSGLYPVSGATNGQRESGATRGYWNDDTNGVWPDWLQAAWDDPIDVSRIVVRIPLAQPGYPVGEITMRRTRIQYWDEAASAWADVVGRSGQANPILDWTGPIGTADGSETRTFDLAAPVRTTRVRVLVEDGSSDGWSWLDELEVYGEDCAGAPTPRDANVAPAATASARWTWDPFLPRYVNDDRRQTSATGGFWRDRSHGVHGDWVMLTWPAMQSLNRVVLRLPWGINYRPDDRIHGEIRVQWWDESIGFWRDVDSAQNPLRGWSLPVTADDAEARQFDFPTVSTRRIRVLFAEAAAGGYSFLEELEAYWVS